MPLFFFVAGIFTFREHFKEKGLLKVDILKSRFSRLMVPYFFVGFCYAPFKLLLSRFANKHYDITELGKIFIGVNPDGELWFLYALFIITVIVSLFDFEISLTGVIIALLLAVIQPILPIISGNLFYFTLGMYVRKYWYNELLHLKNNMAVICLLIFVFGNIAGNAYKHNILTAIAGIMICLWIAQRLSKLDNIVVRSLTTCGIFSMDIYILSDIIKIPFRIVFWNMFHMYYIAFIVCTISSIWLSYYISANLIRRNEFLKRYILGMK